MRDEVDKSTKIKCSCGKMATWMYMPSSENITNGEEFKCDECVPRGCSCNIDFEPIDGNYDNRDESNWIQLPEKLDEQGRRWPCCEWNHYPEGIQCFNCEGKGVVDSGGFTPWDTPIDIPCPVCSSGV